ncbi:DNA-binding transcriptional regulator, LysR family [Amycolatopsis marina]|uniref:DNA-binding transcriptional regulator, LysR family n=1 Tax=Amycolatopsis marina TaxID=490629 RepID=A0A1I1CMF1_9PSEU|nr:LysR family transcriptional regulator [Amycolatopsis marina]SFB61603.1 DNA-binding transcriptional regulator, LysR family [Amycolatopsis marina]
MELEVRHLRVICTIAEAGSLTKAAAQLGLSQPALSNQLRRIEQVLGGPLFVRTRQGATATNLGEFVVARARPALGVIDQLREDTIDHCGLAEDQRPLRYVATQGPLMVGLLGDLERLRPGGVTLRTEADVVTAAELIADGQRDLAAVVTYVQPGPAVPGKVENLTIAEEPAFAIVSAQHPAASRAEEGVALSELSDSSWALPPPQGSGLMAAFAEACSLAGFTARVRHEVEANAARELVAAGEAIGLGQATFRATDNIIAVPLRDEPLRIRHLLLWRAGNTIAPEVPVIARHAREVYRRAVDRSPHYLAWLARRGPKGHHHDVEPVGN